MTLGTLAEKESHQLSEKQRWEGHSTRSERTAGQAVEGRRATRKNRGAGSPEGGPEQARVTPQLGYKLRRGAQGCTWREVQRGWPGEGVTQ